MQQKVYKLLKQIPKGKVTTYKEIAKKLNTKGYQAIGQILKINPDPVGCPCYKVVKSDGSISGYHGNVKSNIQKKIKSLENDGIKIKNGKIIEFEKVLFKY